MTARASERRVRAVPRAPAVPRARILLVEDDCDSAEMLEGALERSYDVTWAASGHEALDLVDNDPRSFDLVLLDLSLPDMEGVELADRLSSARRAQLPIIVVSARTQESIQRCAAKIHAAAAVRKPYSLRGLLDLIANVLAPASRTVTLP
jgi:DNA-binding response OmpR family regulator